MATGWFQDAPSSLVMLDEELACRQSSLGWRKWLSPASEDGRLAILLSEMFLLDLAGHIDRSIQQRHSGHWNIDSKLIKETTPALMDVETKTVKSEETKQVGL